MLKKLIGLFLVLSLSMPGFAFANGNIPEGKCKGTNEDCKRLHDLKNQNWQNRIKQKQQLLLSFVNKYTPDKKKEWEAAIAERNKIMEKWSSPEYAEKKQQWKKEKMAKMEQLHKQYEEGKISKEEFLKKAHSGKEIGQWKLIHELKDSVKSNNDKKTAQLLNQLLLRYKQRNEMMKAELNS